MSRIGKKPIKIPSGVEIVFDNNILRVKGPLGQLEKEIHSHIVIEKNQDELRVGIKNEEDLKDRALWGLFRTLINNMVVGVTQGFEKKLEIVGIGYKVALRGNILILNVGYSHPAEFQLPSGIKAEINGNFITLRGIDKAQVGETAAQIRRIRKPEPYKGKGIKYIDEVIRRKAGKVAKGTEK